MQDTNQEMTGNKVAGVLSKIQRTIGHVLDWFEVLALCLGVAALAAMLIINVIARSFFQSIYFVEELSEFLVLFTSFVGVSYAVRKARHIRMGAIFDALPPIPQKVMIFIIAGISAVVMFLMASYAYSYLSVSRMMGQTTPALRLPYWYFLAIIPIGFASAGIQYIRTIIKNIVQKDVWLSPEQQGEYEEEAY